MARGIALGVVLLVLVVATAQAAPEVGNAGVLPQVHGYDSGQGVLVPLRGVAEWLGAKVVFASPQITVALGNHSAVLTLDARQAVVDGHAVTLSSPARVYGSVTCVPVRFVAESLGAKVGYVAAGSDSLVPLPFVLLSLGERTGRVIVHSEPPNVVALIIADLQAQMKGWQPHTSSPYGKQWIIGIVKVSGGRAKVKGPAWWAGLGKEAAFSYTELSDQDLTLRKGRWHLPPGH